MYRNAELPTVINKFIGNSCIPSMDSEPGAKMASELDAPNE
jgi:hypothetical protein